MTPTALRERRARPQRGERFRRAAEPSASARQVSLEDRYELEQGRVLLTGVQALVRLLLDQHRADAAAACTPARFVSGYQGSPLGGLDKELARNRALCDEHHVRHTPGLNEELGATSAWGSQMATQLPGRALRRRARASGTARRPALDRAADALRHGNFVGVPRSGGALAAVGDDPASKSSTLPSASETLLASLHMPVFFPGDVQDVLDLGLHAFACSRASGLWSGFKVVTNVADALGTAEVGARPRRAGAARPRLRARAARASCCRRTRSTSSARCSAPRTELALEYARVNDVNRVEGARDAWLGHRLRRQGLLRPAPRAARPRPRRARARARRRAPAQARHDLAARAADRARRSPTGSTRCWWSRRSARSSRRSSRSCSTARRTRRGSSASATSRARRCCRSSATSTPT